MHRGVYLCMTGALLLGVVVVPATSVRAASSVVPNTLFDVTCPSSTRCFAVGVSFTKPSSNVGTLVERWNGSSWSIMPSPNSSATKTWLAAVACTTPTSCMAVGSSSNSGYGGKAYVARMTGSAWSTLAAPAGGPKALLRDVACTGAANCFAVGSYFDNTTGPEPVAMRWNGQKWATVAVALPSGLSAGYLLGVGCASASKCFAVGGTQDLQKPNVAIVERWNGARWVVERQFKTAGGVTPELVDLSCPTTTRCRAVGNDGSAAVRTLAAVWNGSSWSIESSANRKSAPENYLLGVSCWTAGECFAVGEWRESHSGPTHTLTERRSGQTWTVVASPNKDPQYNSLSGVDCISAKRCFTVGTSNATAPVVILRWDGTRWTSVKSP